MRSGQDERLRGNAAIRPVGSTSNYHSARPREAVCAAVSGMHGVVQ